ncbi:MAG: M23 family metallopeptidase [Clostridia bacterium]|nr:M23 family metallopeptidase [Clostridia bacterium]
MKENKRTGKRNLFIYYAVLAACLLVIAAVTVTVIFAVRNNQPSAPTIDNNIENGETEEPPEENDQPTLSATEFILPLENVDVLNSFTFYKNSTLNSYHLHTGIDFAAEQGTEVLAVLDGTVESVYTNDVLTGTTVTVAHQNGLKTTYSYIDAKEGLKVGDEVSRGDVLGTVAAPTGKEYKDGAHLHFEILESGKAVDPEMYLSVNDK